MFGERRTWRCLRRQSCRSGHTGFAGRTAAGGTGVGARGEVGFGGNAELSAYRVAARPSSVAAVRSALRGDLAMLPEPVREDVALVATELLGNAMRHGSSLPDGRLAVSWEVDSAGVEIAVTDGGGPTQPVVEEPALTDVGGRGLSIVASLAADWGVERHGAQTTVWAVIAVLAPRLATV